jgi:hypothetical protein
MTNLKPFNLERALAGDPVVTREGRKVRIMCFDRKTNNSHKIVALVENNSFETCETFDENGKYTQLDEESTFDLFMVPKSQKYYVSIFFDESAERIRCGEAELSMRLAESNKKSHYKLLQTIEFEIEEE